MKTFKIMLVSTDPSLLKWNSLASKNKEILSALNTVKNGRFFIEVEYRKDLRPIVDAKGSIDRDWFDGLSGPYLERGYDFCLLHMSAVQKEKFGIRPTLNGAAQTDSDQVGEAYIMCDENEKRGPFNKFIQVFLHEMRHLLKYGTREVDDTHKLHGSNGDIRGHFSTIDMAKYDLKWHYLKSKLTFLQNLFTSLTRMFKKTLFQAATSSLGVDISPRDIAPDVLGCAETVSEVIRKVLPDFPVITGTYTLWKRFENDPQFRKVTIPMPGTIIISPTGTSLKKPSPFPGHVGIFLEGDKIASNTSANGLFEQNYTLETWRKRWEATGQYPIYYYQLII